MPLKHTARSLSPPDGYPQPIRAARINLDSYASSMSQQHETSQLVPIECCHPAKMTHSPSITERHYLTGKVMLSPIKIRKERFRVFL
jgi:hypothetical protein